MSWEPVQPFLQLASDFAATAARDVQRMLADSDAVLELLDGDPARYQWTRFRPLRLSREEDWADWLAHLLEANGGGHFAARLLQHTGSDCVTRVEREVSTPGLGDESDRRLDIVVHWHGFTFTHVEIKVGDQNYQKTHATARSIEKHQPGTWQHVLLVPPDHEDEARSEVDAGGDDDPAIMLMTWRHVAAVLRACMWKGCGTTTWRVLARTLLGAIEQRLLLIGPAPVGATRIRNAPALLALLQESRDDHHDH